MTLWGIKPMTSQLAAQCLNQLCHPEPPQTHITQFTFASTHYSKNICDRYKFPTRSELHNSKHRTHNESLEKCHKLSCSCLLSKTVQLQPPHILCVCVCVCVCVYIYIGRVSSFSPHQPQHFIYLVNKYSYWIFLRHAVQSVFISTKCCVFHNVIFFGL